MTEEDVQAIIAAARMASEQGGIPQDLWHPDFGWVLRNGEPAEGFDAFAVWMEKKS